MKCVAFCVDDIEKNFKKGYKITDENKTKFNRIKKGFINGKTTTDEEVVELNRVLDSMFF